MIMRRKRVKELGKAWYHVMNRVIGKEFLFTEECKDRFVQIMREVEAFTGVRVLTYCVMSNHFHLLVMVNDPKPISDKELLGRYEQLVCPATFTRFKEAWDRCVERKDETGLNELRDRLFRRMNDLSAFMQELKQRFTEWYNAKNDRKGGGTFWSDRFKSVLVEGRCKPLSTVASYIDLNPVRAGMVEDPKEYRWCGYAAAVSGITKAHEGISEVIREFLAVYNRRASERNVLAVYRLILLGKIDGRSEGEVTPEQMARVFEMEGMLPPWALARQKVRWISEGMIIGGKGFVSGQAEKWNGELGIRRRSERQTTPDEAGWCRLREVRP